MVRIRAVLVSMACFFSLLGLSPCGANAQDVAELARSAVARQHLSNEMLLPDDDSSVVQLPLEARDIRLEEVRPAVRGLRVWHGKIPGFHASPYTVAWDGQRLLRLGGFEAPDVIEASAAIMPGRVDGARILQLAAILIGLLDPNGGTEIVLPNRDGIPQGAQRVVDAWKAGHPDGLADTLEERSQRGWALRITSLSRNPDSGYVGWLPIIYAFEFDPAGVVVGWKSEVGELFYVPPPDASN